MTWMMAGFLVLLSTQVFGHAARRIGQPFVMGELVGGVLLGPAFFGALFPRLSERILTPDVIATMRHVGELGVVFFCVGIGWELRRAGDRQGGRLWRVLLPALLLPGALGAAAAVLAPPGWRPEGGSLLALVLLCYCAMTVTALPVLGALLRDLGLLRSATGRAAMSVAGVGDLVCWVLLALALEFHRGASWHAGVGHLLVLLAAAGLIVVLVGRVVRQVLQRRRLGDRAVLTFVLVGACGMAVLAGLADIHPAIAALIFGALLPPKHPDVERVVQPFLDLNSYLLMPFFLVGIGLAFRPWSLGGPWAWAACAGICVLAIAVKVVATLIGGRWAGMPAREAAGLGMLLSARGFTEILLLSVGRNGGIIGDEIFTVGLVVTVVTTLAAAPGYCWVTALRPPRAPHLVTPPAARHLAGSGARADGSMSHPVGSAASGVSRRRSRSRGR